MSSKRIVLIGLLFVALATGAAAGLLTQFLAGPPRSQSIAIGALVGVVGFLAVCAVGGYTDNWTWTGFGRFSHQKQENEEFERQKTLWDAMQVLILPAVLSFGVVFLNEWQTTAEDKRSDSQATVTARTANSQATVTALNTLSQTRDGVLDDYMSKISNLMLHAKLGLATSASCRQPANESDDVRDVVAIARARTLTALQRLNSVRQAVLVRFLVESRLIPAVSLSIATLPKVNLSGMDLSCAQLQYARLPHSYLSYANLSHANLSNANLSSARLFDTRLSHANLSYADLSYADLSLADLSHADLSGVVWYHTRCPDEWNSATNGTSPESCKGHGG